MRTKYELLGLAFLMCPSHIHVSLNICAFVISYCKEHRKKTC